MTLLADAAVLLIRILSRKLTGPIDNAWEADRIMRIIVRFFGPLSEQTGQERIEFFFKPGTTYGHLMDEIGRRFGHRFDKRLWDDEQKIFKAGILSIGEGRDLHNREISLRDGEEIKIIPLLGGG